MTSNEAGSGPGVVEIMITIIGIIVLIGLAIPAHRGLGVRASVAACVEAAQVAGPSPEALLASLRALPQCASAHQSADGSVSVTVHDARADVAPVLHLVLAADEPPGPQWRCSQLAGDPRHMPAECRPTAQPPGPAGMSLGATALQAHARR